MLEIGSLVDGKYRILREVGHGGMSVVYMAINERANKTWAIKEVRKDGTQNFEVVKQGLIVETDMLKRLNHPNLPSIIDVIDGDGVFLIVMDYIEGKTLKQMLDENGPIPQETVIDWAKQLCDVFGYLHSKNIVYRDMKPSNVMLKPDGNVVLFDFGTAREFKASSVEDTTCLGTRGYAAPEQYGGMGQTDARTDIYCLGASFYHLLTGHNPSDPPYTMYPIRQINPALSSGLEQIIIRCTNADPNMRYNNCAELLYDLENYDKEDIVYRRAQVKKFKLFLTPTILGAVFGIAAIALGVAENTTIGNSYDSYIDKAKTSATFSQEVESYRDAIEIDPGRGDAYMGLLKNSMLEDQVFSKSESELLRQIMIDYSGSTTNEEEFRKNSAAYEEFAYEAGIAYFYYYEDKSSKKNAKAYFEVAKNSKNIDEKHRVRAEKLYTICDYYSQIGLRSETGDASITYGQYWNDITSVADGDLVTSDNATTAKIIYSELVSLIHDHVADFKKDGITEEQIEERLDNILTHLSTDFSARDLQELGSDIDELKSNIENTRSIVQVTYHGSVG